MTKLHRRAMASALVAVLALGGAACSDDDDTTETGSAPEEETTTTAAPDDEETTTTAGDDDEAATLEITAIEYEFEGVPESVPAGTTLSLANIGAEPHQIVALLLPASETRSVQEIAALSDEEQSAIFGGEPDPATVLLAASGTTDTPGAVAGDGSLTEPGRYALICFLPVGATDDILNAGGPPEGEFESHVDRGMVAELNVV